MTPIEKLKELHEDIFAEGAYRMLVSPRGHAILGLVPELIALWEAADGMDVAHGEILESNGFWEAIDALNAKAAEVLK